ncbi:hypothetical protein E2320_020680, partial [Naja naja]
ASRILLLLLLLLLFYRYNLWRRYISDHSEKCLQISRRGTTPELGSNKQPLCARAEPRFGVSSVPFFLSRQSGASETVSEGLPPAAAWSREREADAGNERVVGLQQLPARTASLEATLPRTGSLPTPAATVRVVDSASAASKFLLTHNKKIKNTLLNVIGIMQIIFGVTQVSFGIALTAAQQSFTVTVQSGIYFWLGILLLITGSLLIEVEKRQSDLLVKSAFIVNVILCVVGLVAITLHGIEIAQTVKEGNPCDSNPSHYCRNYHQILSFGLNSVFLIFALLEVSLAIVAISRLRTQKQESYQPMAAAKNVISLVVLRIRMRRIWDVIRKGPSGVFLVG